MVKKVLLKGIVSLATIFLLSLNINAQSTDGSSGKGDGIISGRVVDSLTTKPLDLVSIELINAWNGRPVDGFLTDPKGTFKFKGVEIGTYRLEVSFVGYASKSYLDIRITDSFLTAKTGDILLRQVTKNIDNVVIEANAPIIENKVDKLVYNASKDATAKGGNAGDVLRRVPMVTVDLDGNVSLRGSQNIKVLINGKPSSIMAASIADAMKMIPADIIEKVEVITSPSAKYDAEGTAGIINIITKRKNLHGTSGMVNIAAGTRSSNIGGNINFRTGKFGFNMGIGSYFWRSVGKTVLLNQYTGNFPSFFKQNGESKSLGGGVYGTFGADYDINKYNTISLNGRLNGNLFSSGNDLASKFSLDNVLFNDIYRRETNTKNNMIGVDLNLDYRKTYKNPDKEFTASVQYSRDNKTTDYNFDQFSPNDSVTFKEKSHNPSSNTEWTFQTDFVKPFKRKYTLETGLKAILRSVRSVYTYDTFAFNNKEFKEDQKRGNDFFYHQNVGSAYSQIGYKINKKAAAKAGLRAEYTEFGGGFNTTNEKFTGKPYFNFIPYASVNYSPVRTRTYTASFTRRIQRPGFFHLNPYINYNDPRNISYGNKDLQAEVANTYEATYSTYSQKGYSFYLNTYHRRTGNAIEAIQFADSASRNVTTYQNIGKNSTTGFSLNLGMRKKKVTMNLNGGSAYYFVKSTQTTGPNVGLENWGITYNAGLWGSYQMKKRWSMQAYAQFNSPTYTLQGRSTTWYYYSIGGRKETKNKKGGFGFGVDNIFTPFVNFINESKGYNYTFTSNSRMMMWGVRVSFDYRFGKMEFRQEKKKGGIKNDDVKGGGESSPGGGPGGS